MPLSNPQGHEQDEDPLGRPPLVRGRLISEASGGPWRTLRVHASSFQFDCCSSWGIVSRKSHSVMLTTCQAENLSAYEGITVPPPTKVGFEVPSAFKQNRRLCQRSLRILTHVPGCYLQSPPRSAEKWLQSLAAVVQIW